MYCAQNLNLRRKGGKRPASRNPQPLAVPDLANIRWSIDFIQPGKPTRNSYIERFNRTCREEVPDPYIVSRLSEGREVTDRWPRQYNEERPHESLGNLTPAEYLALNDPEVSAIEWH